MLMDSVKGHHTTELALISEPLKKCVTLFHNCSMKIDESNQIVY